MNILVTVNSAYTGILRVMLKSLLYCHPGQAFDVYVMHSTLEKEDFDRVKEKVGSRRLSLISVKIDDSMLAGAPITDRYPKEMYYRIFAARFLPRRVDRILYLDPDLVVLKNLEDLYNIDFDGCYFAAATHVGRFLTGINAARLQMPDDAPYINSGVMMMNISLLRQEQDMSDVINYINDNKRRLLLPDQDVISAVYGEKIKPIDPLIYNMSERLMLYPNSVENGIDADWVKQNSAIVHFCGRNKPWKSSYIGTLGELYDRAKRITLED